MRCDQNGVVHAGNERETGGQLSVTGGLYTDGFGVYSGDRCSAESGVS
jgi:hypothetical protein